MELRARTIDNAAELVAAAAIVALASGCHMLHRDNAPPGPLVPVAVAVDDAAPAAPPVLTIDAIARGASLMASLGEYHRAITTTSPDAQAYFDQGLRLAYGFNHDEAARSFARATQLDPKCASCYWGIALVLGPNYNVSMLPDRVPAARDALAKAQAAAIGATPVEQALIAALATRYPSAAPAVQPGAMQPGAMQPGAMQPNAMQPGATQPDATQPDNQAYADAMAAVAAQFPDDVDVQVLRAEAMMDLNPWKLWTADGKPAPGTDELVALLARVLEKHPDHPGANHYYIHAVEASPHPEKALAAAQRLATLIPGAGHVVHMPAHIYQRVGRYADASDANAKAIEVDEEYLGNAPDWGYYRMYLAHNYGFLAYSASMEGRSAVSIQAAKDAAAHFPPAMLATMSGMDFFVAEPLLAMVRFGKWDDLLAAPRPDARYPTLTALWLHAHGLAACATGKLDAAATDLADLQHLATTIPADASTGTNSLRSLVAVSSAVLAAALAQKKGDPATESLWATAVAAEDKLAYSEPSDWFYPVRHFQGAFLLGAKKYKEAEAVYRADLARNPDNGWSLFGLEQALRGQKRSAEAARIELQRATAWSHADITLTSTSFL